MSDPRGRRVLLFFREADRLVRGDHRVRALVRPLHRLVSMRKQVSGFYVWYRNLALALERAGCRVVCNDRRAARESPGEPVGLVGYPVLLDGWDLPNPAVLGPGMFDHPGVRPDLMTDPRFKLYLVTCGWMRRLFEPVYGERCVEWYGGIDLEAWPDARRRRKGIDVLVYYKIRWRREERDATLVRPVLEELRRRGLRAAVLRYGRHQQRHYARALARSRAMLFLCEHETQGLAYQEALASNVPVLAWDNGFWLDPQRERFGADPVPATSVPYFSPECGERFRDASDFPAALDAFWSRLGAYEPRAYVRRALSLEGSARTYLEHLDRAAGAP